LIQTKSARHQQQTHAPVISFIGERNFANIKEELHEEMMHTETD